MGTQAHWITQSKYHVTLVDAEGEVLRRFRCDTLAEVREELALEPTAVLAKAFNQKTGRMKEIKR